jgi:anthranilate phosphoribosyltransferase
MLRALLAGEDRSPRRDVVLFNAAAALAVDHGDLLDGLREAERALDSGAAQGKLDALIALSQALAVDTSGPVQ